MTLDLDALEALEKSAAQPHICGSNDASCSACYALERAALDALPSLLRRARLLDKVVWAYRHGELGDLERAVAELDGQEEP